MNTRGQAVSAQSAGLRPGFDDNSTARYRGARSQVPTSIASIGDAPGGKTGICRHRRPATSFAYTGAGESGVASAAGKRWNVNNLLELKNAQRVLIDGNIFDHLGGAQMGYAIVLTPRNQDGTAPWSAVRDVTISNNIIRHVPAGSTSSATTTIRPSQHTTASRSATTLFTTFRLGRRALPADDACAGCHRRSQRDLSRAHDRARRRRGIRVSFSPTTSLVKTTTGCSAAAPVSAARSTRIFLARSFSEMRSAGHAVAVSRSNSSPTWGRSTVSSSNPPVRFPPGAGKHL